MGYNYMKQQTLCYTDERNAQIVIELLKAHGITRVAAAGRELFVPDGGETCGGAEDGFLPGTQAEG